MKKFLAWLGWIIAAILVFLHLRRPDQITVIPGKVEKPTDVEQDYTGTLTTGELEKIIRDLRGEP